jgi:recombination protein RecR
VHERLSDGTVIYPPTVQALIDEFSKLPGIGPKSAQRIAFFLLKSDRTEVTALASAIVEAKERSQWCERCFNLSESPLCSICGDPKRDGQRICVVEEPRDVVALERTGEFRGLYHVLQGSLSPIDGIGPEKLRIKELLQRLADPEIVEVILCMNPNLEGEATALYLARLLGPSGISVTRLASGLPVGGDLEYADERTLGKALEGRRSVL